MLSVISGRKRVTCKKTMELFFLLIAYLQTDPKIIELHFCGANVVNAATITKLQVEK